MVLVQIAIIILLAALVSAVLTKIEIPLLISLKTGQNIREEGPQAHLAKAGTPSMGGISIITTFVVLSLAVCFLYKTDLKATISVVLLMLCYGGVGFCDDYLKIVKKQNEGLTSKQKMLLQLVIGIAFAVFRYLSGNTKIVIPFFRKMVDFGILIIPFSVFVFVAMTNAVNLTDGLDGLSSSVTTISSLMLGCTILFSAVKFALVDFLFGFGESSTSAIMAFILSGCCIGFLCFNHYPAKLFMGDTGSLALGACLTGIAMTSGFDFALPVVGLIYVVETLSVIIQVYVYKHQNGRRFFRMAPIHHHFELGGWSEVKIDVIFALVTLGMGVISLLIF